MANALGWLSLCSDHVNGNCAWKNHQNGRHILVIYLVHEFPNQVCIDEV